MAIAYSETPDNFDDIKSYVKSDVKDIKSLFFRSERVVFYDACSFQRHSRLQEQERNILIRYFKEHGSLICITRCVLMELISDHHRLTEEYIQFIRCFHSEGVNVAVFDEEYTYGILSECFSTNETVNGYLQWAVKTVKSTVSTIEETLKKDKTLFSEVIQSEKAKQPDLYYRFFHTVRENKQHDDNLGEELIAVCIHILSHLPGVPDGKLCVVTDDKGAAGKIDSSMRKTHPCNRGSRIILYSTPKLVQNMFREKLIESEEEMVNLLSCGTSGNIVVMGTTAYDLDVDHKISLTGRELAQKIIEPNSIHIVF